MSNVFDAEIAETCSLKCTMGMGGRKHMMSGSLVLRFRFFSGARDFGVTNSSWNLKPVG